VLARNTLTISLLLCSLNAAWCVALLAVVVWCLRPPLREQGATCLRRLLLPAVLALIYLPFYVTLTEQRFFYAAFPFLLGALVFWSEATPSWLPISLKRSLVFGATLLPLAASWWVIGDRVLEAGERSWDMAMRMQHANRVGPMAGSASLTGGRAGLFVAFLLQQPWLGDDPNATPAALKTCGARFVMVRRGSQPDAELTADRGFVNLDRELFSAAEEAQNQPLKVFEVRTAAGGGDAP
jgi:hypothetical protein